MPTNESGLSPYDAGSNPVPYTDTGTGAYDGPPASVTIEWRDHEDGPTGAVPGPPASVTTTSWPGVAPADEPATDTETKSVTADEVENKAVTSTKASTKKRGS